LRLLQKPADFSLSEKAPPALQQDKTVFHELQQLLS